VTAAAEIVAALTAAGQTVATAESLTGGLIAAALTDVPGASIAFRGGVVVYTPELKTRLARVPAELIAAEGVVSEAVARKLAEGAVAVCGADWGIGVTGVAGPGPADGVAAGTVWLAVAGPSGTTAELLTLPGGRADVRRETAARALAALRARLPDSLPPGG
jgi:nicotinamide-nucleotide amidase